MKFLVPTALTFVMVLAGCTLNYPWDKGLPLPVIRPKNDPPKIEPKLQSESVVSGTVMWKWDRELTHDVILRDGSHDGFAKDIWLEYIFDVRMDFGDHEEVVELMVAKEIFENTRELTGVKVKRSLYSDGSRSYELVLEKK